MDDLGEEDFALENNLVKSEITRLNVEIEMILTEAKEKAEAEADTSD